MTIRKCLECGKDFNSGTTGQKICSHECRAERVHRQNLASEQRRQLNKRNPSSEAVALESMALLNTNKPKHDGHILKAKRLHSPDTMKMPFRIEDKRMKTIHFFKTEAARDRFIERNSQQPQPSSLKKGGRAAANF